MSKKFGIIDRMTTKAITKLQKMVDGGVLAKTTIKQQCRMTEVMIKVNGIVEMRSQLMIGFPHDFELIVEKQPGITVSQILEPYRAEPAFQKLIDKVQISWAEIEQLAIQGGAVCDTQAQ